MSPDKYRCYRSDENGRVYDAEWISALGDEEAVDVVKLKYPNFTFEVWRGSRLVGSDAGVSEPRASAGA